MNVNFGIQWLMILGVSVLWTDYSLAVVIPTSNVETKLDKVVVVDDLQSKIFSEIKLVKQIYIQMAYFIQRNGSTTDSPTLISTLTNKLEPVTVCVVSEDELKEIQNVIDSVGTDSDTPEIVPKISSNCTELDKLKLGILKLKNAYLELLKHRTSPVKYEELKAIYEAKMKDFRKKMNDAVKRASDHKKAMIEKLQSELQSQANRYNEILRLLDEKQKQLNDLNIEVCASRLMNGLIDAALDAYNNNTITTKDRMPRVIEEAYSEDMFNKLFDFINKTGDSVSKLYGYTALFDKMKSNNHMSILNLLILTNGVGRNKEAEFSKLLSSLEDSLIAKHRNEDYETFFSFVPQRPSNLSDEIANGIMAIFVRGAYQTYDVEHILDMQSEFVDIYFRLYLFNSLVTEIKNLGHTNRQDFFKVIYDVIRVRREPIWKGNKLGNEIFEQIYENVPESIRPLMYKHVCIQNVFNEYVVTGDEISNTRRSVVTKIGRNLNAAKFEITFLDRGVTVIIKNSGATIYSAYYGLQPRDVYAWTPGSLEYDKASHFTIEFVDDKNVRIKNDKYKEYLFSPSKYYEKDRKVMSSKEASTNSLWKLTTCNLPI